MRAMNTGAFSSDASPASDSEEQALYAAVYHELRQLARRQRQAFGSNATLNTTALVHEAYFKLRSGELSLQRRAQFFAAAARAMRQVLVDYARRRGARKRGADLTWTELDENTPATATALTDVIALDRALNDLGLLEPALATLVDWHVFAGLGIDRIAEFRGVSERTIFRDWRRARAFLLSRLEADD